MRYSTSLLLTAPLLLALTACDEQKPAAVLSEATAQAIAAEMNEKSRSLLKNLNLSYEAAPATGAIEGDGYRISFPVGKVKLAPMAGEKDFGYAELPAYSLHLTPETADTYKFNGEGYKSIGVMNKEGEKLAEIRIAKSDVEGVWKSGVSAYAQYPHINISWGDVSFADAKGDVYATLKNIGSEVKSSEAKAGKLDRSTRFTFEGFALTEKALPARFSIEKVDSSYTENGVDLAATESFYKTITDLQDKVVQMEAKQKAARDAALAAANADATEETAVVTPPEPASVEEIKGLMNQVVTMFEMLAKLNGNTALEAKLTNLDFAFKDGEDDVHITLPQINVKGTGSISEAGLVTSNVAYSHSGFKMTPLPQPQLADYIPSDVAFGYGVKNLPLTGLAGLLREVQAEWEAKLATSPNALPVEALADGKYADRLVALLDEAKAAFVIDSLDFTSPALSGKTQGEITANKNAKFKASGKIESVITGMDELMGKLQTRIAAGSAADATPEAKAQAEFDQGAMMGMTMIQAMGTSGTGLKGSTRTYTFELGEDGSTKLNGVDYSGLISSFVAPRPTVHMGDETMGDEESFPGTEEQSDLPLGTDAPPALDEGELPPPSDVPATEPAPAQ